MRLAFRLCVLLVGVLPLAAADWPHWRGPTRDGVTGESSGWDGKNWLPERPAWTATVGEGSSSPVVLGGHVYVLGHADGKDVLRCLSADEGKEEWAVSYKCPRYGRHHAGDEGLYSGPSSTPEYDPDTKRIYTLGVDGDLNCFDTAMKGKRVWGVNLYDGYGVGKRPKLTRAPQRDYGYTSSPMVYADWLLVEVGSTKRGTVVAFDRKTGKEMWASELKDEAGHTGGPALITVDDIPCVAVLSQRNLAVIRLDGDNAGKTLATFPWVTDFANTIAGPAVHGRSVILAAGYNHNAMVRVDVTKDGAKEVWRTKAPSKVCTPVIHDGSVYVAWQRVRCVDWETGKLRWEGGAVGDPGSCIVTSDGRLIVYGGQRGKLLLVEGAKRSPEKYVELAGQDGLLKALAWPHVVLAGGRLVCRDRDGRVACFAPGK